MPWLPLAGRASPGRACRVEAWRPRGAVPGITISLQEPSVGSFRWGSREDWVQETRRCTQMGKEGFIQLPIYSTPCRVNEKRIKGRGLLSLYFTGEAAFPEGMSGQRSRRNTQTIPDFFGRSVCGARAFGGFFN